MGSGAACEVSRETIQNRQSLQSAQGSGRRVRQVCLCLMPQSSGFCHHPLVGLPTGVFSEYFRSENPVPVMFELHGHRFMTKPFRDELDVGILVNVLDCKCMSKAVRTERVLEWLLFLRPLRQRVNPHTQCRVRTGEEICLSIFLPSWQCIESGFHVFQQRSGAPLLRLLLDEICVPPIALLIPNEFGVVKLVGV